MASPVVIFVYSRVTHTRLTIESLLLNPESVETDLIVFSDGARSPEEESSVAEVRRYISEVKGFRSVTIYQRPSNYGLATSIIEGVSQVLLEHDRVIVLEDDMVVSAHFLKYMNEGLDRFMNDDRVISIHGYVYPVMKTLPEAFFLRGADCWVGDLEARLEIV